MWGRSIFIHSARALHITSGMIPRRLGLRLGHFGVQHFLMGF
jgi:hypothetical protein